MKRSKRIGLMLWPAPALNAGFERGLWAERAGYDDVWLPDAEGLQDPIALAAALGVATENVRLCTGIVPVFNRPPPVLATGVVTAEQRAPGRFVLGIGPSTSNMIDRWYGMTYDKPLTRVRETLLLLREILSGKKTDFAGETVRSKGFKLQESPISDVPIFLGAIGPKMLALAGEIADGVLLNDFTPPDRLDWALAQIDAGAKRTGRRVDDLEIVKRRAIYTTDDDATGLEYFRRYLGYYGSAPAYQAVMRRLGYDQTVAEIQAAYAQRDREGVTAAVSDQMVSRIFGYGSASQCRELVRRDFDAGIDTMVVSPQGPTADDYARGADAFCAEHFELPNGNTRQP